jgi:2-phosphosulfolactate phosphatase
VSGESPEGARPEIRVFPTPSGLEALDPREHACIVVDVLRASTTIAYALDGGARGVIPVETVEEATRLFAGLDRETTLLAGERRSVPIEGFHLGNSPAEFRPDVVAEKTIVLSTTNGARALAMLTKARHLATAGFVNVSAVARAAAGEPSVAIVCAGSAGRFSLEDFLCAGILVEEIVRVGGEAELDDGARTARQVAGARASDLLGTIRETDHGRALARLGFERDLALACAVDRFSLVPILRDGRLVAEAFSTPTPPR